VDEPKEDAAAQRVDEPKEDAADQSKIEKMVSSSATLCLYFS
jgi:hypothetical protein